MKSKPLLFGIAAATFAAGGTLYVYENYAQRHPRNLF